MKATGREAQRAMRVNWVESLVVAGRVRKSFMEEVSSGTIAMITEWSFLRS